MHIDDLILMSQRVKFGDWFNGFAWEWDPYVSKIWVLGTPTFTGVVTAR